MSISIVSGFFYLVGLNQKGFLWDIRVLLFASVLFGDPIVSLWPSKGGVQGARDMRNTPVPDVCRRQQNVGFGFPRRGLSFVWGRGHGGL